MNIFRFVNTLVHSKRYHILYTLCLGLACFFVYTANGRYIGAGDCVPAAIMPVAIARGDGPWLDRYRQFIEDDNGKLPGYCELSRSHVVSRYPVGPGLVLAPLVVPQVWLWDSFSPGWDQNKPTFELTTRRMAKTSASLLVAASMSLLYLWLASFTSHKSAALAAIAAAFGTGLFTTASQASWQHGPAVFCLMLAITCLHFFAGSSQANVIAGIATAMIVVCRLTDLPIAFALWLCVTRRSRRDVICFTLSATIVAAAWITWNIYFFDHPNGGYSEIEKMHGWAHGVKGSWSTPILTGLSGTLLSPSHGLFIYSPWVVAALAGIYFIGPGREARQPQLQLANWLTISLVPTLVIYSKYSCWWAGHCFGPRFWIDSTPIFAALFAISLDQLQMSEKKTIKFFMSAAVIASIAIHSAGWLTYPTSWHSTPTNADRDHARLWDWRDNEITRGLVEGVHGRQWGGL
ncbi:MAG: hypothetical protein ACKO5E_07960 [bacterium]